MERKKRTRGSTGSSKDCLEEGEEDRMEGGWVGLGAARPWGGGCRGRMRGPLARRKRKRQRKRGWKEQADSKTTDIES